MVTPQPSRRFPARWNRWIAAAAAAASVLAIGAVVFVLRPSPVSVTFVTPTRTATPRPTVTASPTPSATPSASPTPSPSPSASASPTTTPSPSPSLPPCTLETPQACTVDNFLKMIPKFPEAPTPVPVTVQPAGEGLAANFSKLPVSQPVAFLTIDDGKHKTELTKELIRRSGIPVSIFLTTKYSTSAADVAYFNSILNDGALVDNHSDTHPVEGLPALTYEQQKVEICTAQDKIEQQFGRRPINFRPPYLRWNEDTLRAAWDCGITAVVRGNVGVSGTNLDRVPQAGDIIVLHFKPGYEFAVEFVSALRAIKESGLTPALVTDYFVVG